MWEREGAVVSLGWEGRVRRRRGKAARERGRSWDQLDGLFLDSLMMSQCSGTSKECDLRENPLWGSHSARLEYLGEAKNGIITAISH